MCDVGIGHDSTGSAALTQQRLAGIAQYAILREENAAIHSEKVSRNRTRPEKRDPVYSKP
jgi:hypothetical protein